MYNSSNSLGLSISVLAWANLLKLLWVPGSSEMAGNECADEQTRKGSESKFIDPEPVVGRKKLLKSSLNLYTDYCGICSLPDDNRRSFSKAPIAELLS